MKAGQPMAPASIASARIASVPTRTIIPSARVARFTEASDCNATAPNFRGYNATSTNIGWSDISRNRHRLRERVVAEERALRDEPREWI
jgi:hypothetical protein